MDERAANPVCTHLYVGYACIYRKEHAFKIHWNVLMDRSEAFDDLSLFFVASPGLFLSLSLSLSLWLSFSCVSSSRQLSMGFSLIFLVCFLCRAFDDKWVFNFFSLLRNFSKWRIDLLLLIFFLPLPDTVERALSLSCTHTLYMQWQIKFHKIDHISCD